MDKSFLVLYRVETPLHMGSGTELGVVDMPIQREKVTGFPKLEASGIKGSIRRIFKQKDDYLTNAIFGPEDDGSEYSSCISFRDGEILLFPVKSTQGIFKWITCPFVLNRFIKNYNLFLGKNEKFNSIEKNQFYSENKDKDAIEVILEDFKFQLKRIKECSVLNKIISLIKEDENTPNYLKNKIVKEEIIILSDDSFRFFTEMSTEINTRIKIGDKGIITEGPFTEEYLPIETIMYGFVSVDKFMMDERDENTKKEKERLYKKMTEELKAERVNEFDYVKKVLNKNSYIQLGGNKTLGKGITQLILGGE
ncbi:type III-B CRISPR module RAMP protein Cmr4 [Paramaledivibacter caminithermalis]|jgi:CRISPR-associated protein Cmr4|uniref:CRISPR-associated protein Cmr4 n=1 Tax=Paramaledivibacter caminithermalis (strain DSM 15212 / CIP 107654 / DViRD3) TaxID=1121301 RepID=A0A1M6QT89_PARC5|nr:type III-B CRISPR module RAMP protein Cmr4 [Paramaledivibacter caminithermalis]SHK23318.1 CRISPR-associated protein Cmr4 [Paramaledivibacter caminithermalis DSM 15212]